MKKRTKWIIALSIVLLIGGMIFFPMIRDFVFSPNESASGGGRRSSSEKENLSVNAMVLKYEDMEDLFVTKGILIPDEEVALSFETSGKITDIYFKEGTFVTKGALLAKMNDKPLQAELTKLQAQIPLANERVFRQKSLLEKDAVSHETYEAVVTELEKLQADIEMVKARIDQTELKAPFDGQVGLRMVSEGAYVSPTTVITVLTKITPLKIEFSVNERQANNIKAGTKLLFTVGNDLLTKYNAVVYAVESKLDEETLSLKARAMYANTNGRLKPGHSANIEIKLQEYKNTLVIPSIAIITELGRDIAYIYKNGTAHQVTLTKGMRTASSVQILEGLHTGDTLLVSGVMQLREGMPVTITDLRNE